MRKATIFILITAIIFMVNCKDNRLSEQESTSNKRVFSLSAVMPEDELQTKMALTKEDRNIKLTWEDGDQLQLCFVQGVKKIKQTVTVKSISTDRKKAQFDIVVPVEITSGSFDLYGVYGGGGLSDSNPVMAVLPSNAENAVSLADVKTRKDVMLKFAKTNIEVSNPVASVTFQHIGSLFCISLKNTGSGSLSNIKQARIKAFTNNWAYNTGAGGGQYDLVNNTFSAGTSSGNYLSFNAAASTLAAGGTMTFWAWYPPVPSAIWPQLNLELIKVDDTSLGVSTNTKPARTSATAAGKSFYFYATWDGSQLKFSNAAFTPVEDLTLPGDLLHAENGSNFIGVVYSRSGTLYYNEVLSDGTWSGEVSLGTGTEARIAVDGADHPHVVYRTADNKIAYLKHNGSAWSSISYIESNNGAACSYPDIAVQPNGVAHITYTDANGDGGGYKDIMYATNSSGSFVKTLIYDGTNSNMFREEEYYNDGSRIAVDGTGKYFIMTHVHLIEEDFMGTRYNYGLSLKTNTVTQGTMISSLDDIGVFDLEFNGSDVKALYKYHLPFPYTNSTSTLKDYGSSWGTTDTQPITTAITSSTLSANASAIVIGGSSSSVLFTKYNSVENLYTGVITKTGTSVAVAHIGDLFYVLYTDNADGKIKIKKVVTSL